MTRIVPTFALVFFLVIPALAQQRDLPFALPPDAAAADWGAFSRNLVHDLATGNDGVKCSALQMIIRHGARLHVRAAAFDVVRIYQDHPNEAVRRLALVAIGHLDSPWAVGFLRMSEPFENSPVLKATLRDVVKNYEGRQLE